MQSPHSETLQAMKRGRRRICESESHSGKKQGASMNASGRRTPEMNCYKSASGNRKQAMMKRKYHGRLGLFKIFKLIIHLKFWGYPRPGLPSALQSAGINPVIAAFTETCQTFQAVRVAVLWCINFDMFLAFMFFVGIGFISVAWRKSLWLLSATRFKRSEYLPGSELSLADNSSLTYCSSNYSFKPYWINKILQLYKLNGYQRFCKYKY